MTSLSKLVQTVRFWSHNPNLPEIIIFLTIEMWDGDGLPYPYGLIALFTWEYICFCVTINFQIPTWFNCHNSQCALIPIPSLYIQLKSTVLLIWRAFLLKSRIREFRHEGSDFEWGRFSIEKRKMLLWHSPGKLSLSMIKN